MNKQPHPLLQGWRIHVVGAMACLVATGLIYVMLISPAIRMQQEHERLMPTVTQKEEALLAARSSLTALKKELEQTQTQVHELPLRLDSASQVNSRLARIADLAASTGLEVHAMQPKDTWSSDRYDTVPIGISGEGDYHQVTSFMREVHERFADIAVIDFTLKSRTSTTGRAEFNIGLAWYTMPAMGMVEN